MSGQGRPELATVDAAGLSLAIAATRWNAEITDSLVDRAMAAGQACGVHGRELRTYLSAHVLFPSCGRSSLLRRV